MITYGTFFWIVLKKLSWAPISIISLLIIFLVFDVFILWSDVDIPMHILGGIVSAYFFNGSYLIAERSGLIGQPTKLVRPIMVFALGSTNTILWEFAEFISDRTINTRLQGDLNDTLLDMFLGMVGICFLLLLSRVKPEDVKV